MRQPRCGVIALEKQRRELPCQRRTGAYALGAATARREGGRALPIPSPCRGHPGATVEACTRRASHIFSSLVFCLMVGTAALPHVLMRYYTTPSVREARQSVFWSLLFILALYLTAPAYAVFAKYEIYMNLVNTEITRLPGWIAAWGKVGLISIEDINRDGILQLAELTLNPDVIVLATPEIAGLPYVISGLVAAGGAGGALSTADGLLLTITGAMSHDVYYKMIRPQASTQWRLVISKSLLLVVAVIAAMFAAQKPATILSMVAWAFSIAGSAFSRRWYSAFSGSARTGRGQPPAWWRGLLVTLYYMLRVQFDSIDWLGLHGIGMEPWLDIQSTAAGIWGFRSVSS